MGFRPFRLVHLIARIGRPLLRLLGISDKTAVAKGVAVTEILDPVLPDKDRAPQPDAKE